MRIWTPAFEITAYGLVTLTSTEGVTVDFIDLPVGGESYELLIPEDMYVGKKGS